MVSKFVIVLAIFVAICTGDVRIDLKLSARGLPNMDIFDGPPDPYAIVYYARNSTDRYVNVGQTDYVNNDNNPNWREVFSFNFTGGFSQQRIQVEIYDSDIDADDYIGTVEFRLRDVYDAFGFRLSKDLNPAGKGLVVVNGTVLHGLSDGAGIIEPRIQRAPANSATPGLLLGRGNLRKFLRK